MVEIIETNLIIDENKDIRDHQSRIIVADDWATYCRSYKDYSGKSIKYKSKSRMTGATIRENNKIEDLEYDEFHLYCKIISENYSEIRLAYLID